MKVIVTGHMGFVGKHLMNALAGFEVFGYDKKDVMHADLSDHRWAGFIGDHRPDVIVHLASSCSTLGSIVRPEETFKDTVMTTVTVCKAAAALHVPLVLTSSVKARDGMTPYGTSKVMAEAWAREMSATFGFPLIINRPGTIYGPGQEGSTESGWVAWFLKAKREGLKVTLNGDGWQTRDLLHVFDYVDLLMLQIMTPGLYAGGTWDVGGGAHNVVAVKELADWLGLEYDFGPPRYGDCPSYISKNLVPDWHPSIHWEDADVFKEFK